MLQIVAGPYTKRLTEAKPKTTFGSFTTAEAGGLAQGPLSPLRTATEVPRMAIASYVYEVAVALPSLGLAVGQKIAIPSFDALTALCAAASRGDLRLAACQPTLQLVEIPPDLGQRSEDPVPIALVAGAA